MRAGLRIQVATTHPRPVRANAPVGPTEPPEPPAVLHPVECSVDDPSATGMYRSVDDRCEFAGQSIFDPLPANGDVSCAG